MPHQQFTYTICEMVRKIGGYTYAQCPKLYILNNIILSFDFPSIEDFNKDIDNILHNIDLLKEQYSQNESEFTIQVKNKELYHDHELYISTYIKLLNESKTILNSWKTNVFLHDGKVRINCDKFIKSYRRICKILEICERLGIDLAQDYYCVICSNMFLDECGHGPYYFVTDSQYNTVEPKKKY